MTVELKPTTQFNRGYGGDPDTYSAGISVVAKSPDGGIDTARSKIIANNIAMYHLPDGENILNILSVKSVGLDKSGPVPVITPGSETYPTQAEALARAMTLTSTLTDELPKHGFHILTPEASTPIILPILPIPPTKRLEHIIR